MADELSKIQLPNEVEYDIKDATARSALQNKANNTQTFSMASSRENIASGETVPTLFGKIQKWFNDLDVDSMDDNGVYLYRQSPANGTRALEEIVGGSVGWNQILSNDTMSAQTSNGVTFTPNSDGSYSISGTASGRVSTSNVFKRGSISKTGHKYLLSLSKSIAPLYLRVASSAFSPGYTRESIIVNGTADVDMYIYFDSVDSISAACDIGKVFVYMTDLTALFGTAIADYAASLETATAGSGIAWLKSQGFFTEDYYAYDSGSVQSVVVDRKEIRNSDDEIVQTITYDHSKTLRGIPKLVNNSIQYDGDVYRSDGGGSVKYGEIDLGSLTWYYQTTHSYFYAMVSGIKNVSSYDSKANLVCGIYTVATPNQVYRNEINKTISGHPSDPYVWIYDSAYTDETAFKNAMNGVKLVYELATPTTLSATPYTNPQKTAVGGTEEFVDYAKEQGTRDVAVPVGHQTQYKKLPAEWNDDYMLYLQDKAENALQQGWHDSFAELSDTSFSNLSNGQIPKWNSVSGKWENASDIEGYRTVTGKYITVTDAAALTANEYALTFSPVQDINGYEYPWAEGARKNKLDVSQYISDQFSKSGEEFTNTSTDSRTTFVCRLRSGTNIYYAEDIRSNGKKVSDAFTIESDVNNLNIRHSGADIDLMISFTQTIKAGSYKLVFDVLGYNPSVVGGLSIKNIMLIPSTETNTDFAPYSNICPIHGVDEVGVRVRGINLADVYGYSAQDIQTPSHTRSTTNNYGTTLSTTDFTEGEELIVTQTNHSASNQTSYQNGYFCVGIQGLTYGDRYNFKAKINITSNPLSVTRLAVLPNGSNTSYIDISNGYLVGNFVFTQNGDDREYLEIRCCGASFKLSDIMIVPYGTEITDYEPYVLHSTTITLPSTVYGGSVEQGGSGVSNMASVDLGSLSWSKDATTGQFRAKLSPAPYIGESSVKANAVCSGYPIVPYSSLTDKTAAVYFASVNGINVLDSSYSDAESFKTAMSGIQLVYEVGSPASLSVTPFPQTLLEGVNNVWAEMVENSTVIDNAQQFLSYQPENIVGELRVEIASKANTADLGDLAYINEDGDSSTKFLRGDGTWQNVSSGASSLSQLSDVNLSSPADGQILKYDSATSKWINATEYSYTLPTASASTKGGIKVGDNLSMNGEVLSAKTVPWTKIWNYRSGVSFVWPSDKSEMLLVIAACNPNTGKASTGVASQVFPITDPLAYTQQMSITYTTLDGSETGIVYTNMQPVFFTSSTGTWDFEIWVR